MPKRVPQVTRRTRDSLRTWGANGAATVANGAATVAKGAATVAATLRQVWAPVAGEVARGGFSA